MTNKPLPQEMEIEQNLIGLMLKDEAVFDIVKTELSSEEFYSTQNRLIFSAMLQIAEQGIGIDLLTVRHQLETEGNLEEAGTSSYLTYLIDIAVNGSDVKFQVKKIKESANQRDLWKMGHELAKAVEDEDVYRVNKIKSEISEYNLEASNKRVLQLSNHQPDPIKWIVQNAIPDTYPTMIYGEGGLGKSYLALDLGILTTLGDQTFLNLKFYDKALNVLYLDWELDADEIPRRAIQISKGLNLPNVPENLFYLSPDKTLQKSIPKIKEIIKSKDIGLVIIDSLGASAVDGESVPDIVSLFSKIKNFGIATIILDHQAKMQYKDNYNQKTPFGSVYKFNLARSVFQLVRATDSDSEGNQISLLLRHKKSNFGKLLDDLVFDISWQGDRVLFLESNALPPEERDLKLVREAIKELSEEGGRVNQKNLKLNLQGTIGKNRVSELLDKGSGTYWNSEPGLGKEIIYKPIMLNDNSYELPEVLRD